MIDTPRQFIEPQPIILPQLQMLLLDKVIQRPPALNIPSGYRLRLFNLDEDVDRYVELMHEAGFNDFTPESTLSWANRVIPQGFFIIEHQKSGDFAATALCNHEPTPFHPNGGELGWVAGARKHAGKHLGQAVCSAVIQRFVQAGYRRIYLKTDDWRYPAIKTYLNLGFVPFLFSSEIKQRWRTVCETLGWPYDPASWPKVGDAAKS